MKKFLFSLLVAVSLCAFSSAERFRSMGITTQEDSATIAIIDADEKDVAADVKAGENPNTFPCNTKADRFKCETILKSVEPLKYEGVIILMYMSAMPGNEGMRYIDSWAELRQYIRGEK